MNKARDYISPIFEHRIGDNGSGIAGFTVHIQSKPFVNHIRLFNWESHDFVLAELHKLYAEIQGTRDANN